MTGLLDLGDAPTPFLLALTVVASFFVLVPVVAVLRLARERTRRRTWTPTTATLLATRTESHGSGDDRRTVTRGRWEYRDQLGTTQTGEGAVDGAWVDRTGGEQRIDVLVDPADPSRSQVAIPTGGAAQAFVLVVMAAFGVLGVLLLVAALRALTA